MAKLKGLAKRELNQVNYTLYRCNGLKNECPKVDCVLLSQHGYDGRDYLSPIWPDFHKALGIRPEVLRRYLELERDVGATELAHEVAMRLGKGISSAVVEVKMPRGIVDANRARRSEGYGGVRTLFADPLSGENLRTFNSLSTLHGNMLETMERLLFALDPSVLVDVHSMAPFTPRAQGESEVSAVKLEPGKVSEYMDAWLNPARQGERRFVDIVTCLADGTELANMQLAKKLAESFDASGFKFRFNEPYPTAPGVMTTHYLSGYEGVCIDVPKDYLADGPLDAMVVNAKKVGKMAKSVAAALTAQIRTVVQPVLAATHWAKLVNRYFGSFAVMEETAASWAAGYGKRKENGRMGIENDDNVRAAVEAIQDNSKTAEERIAAIRELFVLASDARYGWRPPTPWSEFPDMAFVMVNAFSAVVLDSHSEAGVKAKAVEALAKLHFRWHASMQL